MRVKILERMHGINYDCYLSRVNTCVNDVLTEVKVARTELHPHKAVVEVAFFLRKASLNGTFM